METMPQQQVCEVTGHPSECSNGMESEEFMSQTDYSGRTLATVLSSSRISFCFFHDNNLLYYYYIPGTVLNALF